MDLTDKIQKVKPSKRKEVVEQVGLAILDKMQSYLESGESPVSGGSYKKQLSKEYAKKVGKKISDLDLTGSMLGNLGFDAFKNKIVFKITDPEQKLKAFNHNVGDTLPQRQFLPNDDNDETFKKGIITVVNRIIKDASED